jgi:uncharacterized protein DUF4402
LNQWGIDKMNKFLRMASLGATVAALTVATQASAFGLVNATSNANAHVKINKGLVLTSTQNLDLGTVVLAGSGTWTGAVVAIDRNDVFNCDGGSSVKVVCSGAHQRAMYNLTGTNNAAVTIAAGNVTLTNAAGDTLTLAPDFAASQTLPNSGNAGLDFGVGGQISVDYNTPDGDYTGAFAVTAEYQ